MGFVHDLFLGEPDVDVLIALAADDLLDDLESDEFAFFDVLGPVLELGSVLGPDNLI